MSDAPRWSDTVVEGVVGGRPGRFYRERPTSVRAVLEASRRWSSRPFIIHGDRTVTFAEHEELVHRTAARLHRGGVCPGDRVGILARNSPEWVATFFAIMELGAVAVPFNGWWSGEEIGHACEVVEPTAVVADTRLADRLPPGVQCLPVRDPRAAAEPDSTDATLPVVELGEDAPAVILFTAGTTAFPKGATLSHRALIANLQTLLVVSRKLPDQISDDLRPSSALVGLPLFHIGAIQLILVPLMTGSTIVFLEGRFDAANVLALFESEKVTMFSGVPTMMERLLAHPDVRTRDVTSLRTVVLGGSTVDDALLGRIRTAFTATTRGVGQTYGLTEAGGVVSTGVGAQMRDHPGSSGQLAPVVEIQIRRPDAAGAGEIYVRSPAGMDGYWGLPDDDTVDVDGWLRTGDIGRVDDDRYLYVSGRAKDVIIRGGENIAAARVESVLREHPAVAEVAVVGLPDPDLGEVVGAAVRLAPPHVAGRAELEEFARLRMAHFAVPSRWWFRTDPLPVNDAGKVLKRTLVDVWPVDAENRVEAGQ